MNAEPGQALRLLIANKYWFAKGGTETYLFDLAERLAPLGCEVIPFSMAHPRNAPTPYARHFVPEVDYDRPLSPAAKLGAAARLLWYPEAARHLGNLLAETRPDLAHVHNLYHQLSPSVLPVLKRHGLPVVMTLHDLKLACPNYKMRTGGQVCERCLPRRYHQAVLHRCVRGSLMLSALCAAEMALHRRMGVYENNVDFFITPSEFFRRKFIESGLPADRLVSIPTFVAIERYEPADERGDWYLYVGRLSEEKGVLSLVRAAEGMPGRLLVAGEGPVKPALQSLIAERRMTNVELIGYQSGHALIDLVRRARFTVVPSEWYENCPRSAVESLACATPVVAANIGGLPEMIEDGKEGLLFEPFSVKDLREKMLRLYEDPALAERLGQNGRLKAHRVYSAEAHLERLLAVYARVLGRAPLRGAGPPGVAAAQA